MTQRGRTRNGWLRIVAALLAMGGAAAQVPALRVHAQAQATPKGQSPPAREWPPGWKLYEPYPEELAFVTPQATVKVASEVRTLRSGINDEHKFKGGVISDRILLDNPYLDPKDPFCGIPRQIACLPDGSLAVASTAKLHKDGRFKDNPYASGFWRIAPDGAITPIAAKHTIVERSQHYPVCGMPFQKSSLDPDIKPMTVAPDGSLVFPYESRVLRLTPSGRVEGIPNRPESCAVASAPAATSPFKEPEAVVQVVNPYESHYKFSLDGWEYHYYCCSWSVGWQGDVDSDEYCFKIKTITKAEMKEIEDLFNMQA